MNLNRKSFTYRLYSWCCVLSSKLFNEDSHDGVYISSNTNLCPMMRTIFIWTPAYLAILVVLIFGLGYILFYLPNTYGGAVGYMNTYLIPAVVIGGIVGLVFLIGWICAKFENRHIETHEEMKARHEAGNYTFWEMLCNWVEAKHEKVCPLVVIVEDSPKSESVEKSKEDKVDKKVDKKVVDEMVDEIVDEIVDEMVDEVTTVFVETPTSSSVDVKFLNRWMPNFSIFLAAAVVIGLVALLNWMMAFAMETDEIIFEKAQCVGSYNADEQSGKIVCGEYTLDTNSLGFVSKVIILKQTPVCEVTKGTLTDDVNFECEYT